ncbi:MAG: alpha/beta hydrolase-fold protein [Ruminococcus flavefaciens]|nr:alpha/beta hydrolase-fold protein [Ruminococcus flavefaciens]MCM1059721.1 alpha/beta hydrolase-fold protein [Eubacterium sp.]
MKMKKIMAVLASMVMLMSAASCQNGKKETDSSENGNTVVSDEASAAKLNNLMTATERSRVSVGELTLLDEDVQDAQTESTGRVQVYIGTIEDLRQDVEEIKDVITPEEYEDCIKEINELNNDFKYINSAFVDGRRIYTYFPDFNYNGGEIGFYISDTKYTEGEYTSTEDNYVQFENFDEFKEYLKEKLTNNGAQSYEDTIALWQSVIDGTYKEISKEEADTLIDEYEENLYTTSFNGDYKDTWEYDRSEVEEIKDSVREISIYDEELDTEFLVHVTLPPNFDKSKTYPMFVFSDGVWRFGNVPSIRKLMENGEIQDVILVTIGYNYKIDGTSMQVRSKYFYEERDKMLDFMTDNLAPYLSELYNIDFEHSGFYGHSAGGVMAHYAVFNSDKYENQPFKYYIIGSPALWELHRLDNEKYSDANVTDYNYWDRNDTLDKVIFLCGGENEDPEYEEYYDGYDTTLEGIANLMSRLESHGVTTAKSKIYENSGHWQFIPDMFIEFFREYYAK